MKPFNLERALAGDPVVTRSGLKVHEIFFFKSATMSSYPVMVSILGNVLALDENGKYLMNHDSPNDLFMAPKTKKVKMSLYKSQMFNIVGYESHIPVSADFIKEIEVEMEE